MMKIRLFHLSAILLTALVLAGCGASQVKEGTEPAQRTLADVMDPGDTSLIASAHDPWEGYNRWMYNFNARFDRYIFMPVAQGYKKVFPGFVRTGIHNFMRNIREPLNIVNGLLQFRFRTAGRSTGRLIVNSTVGMAGLLDPATDAGLYYQKEDFGQTLGVWGVGGGPYFVLPILGPSNVRDAFGFGVDFVMWKEMNFLGYYEWADDQTAKWPTLLYVVDVRANTAFRYYETGSIYEYLWVRQLYDEFRGFEIQR